MAYPDYRLTSPPMAVEWAGWTSDTYTLSRNGWDISVDEDIESFGQNFRVAMRNETLQLYGISRRMHIDHLTYRIDPDYWKSVVIQMNTVSHDIHFYHQGKIPQMIERFRPIDPVPRYEESNIVAQHKTPISQMSIFRTVDPNAPEIILTKPSLDQILDMALEMQEPRQKEIRQELLKRKDQEEMRQPANIKAQLMLVA